MTKWGWELASKMRLKFSWPKKCTSTRQLTQEKANNLHFPNSTYKRKVMGPVATTLVAPLVAPLVGQQPNVPPLIVHPYILITPCSAPCRALCRVVLCVCFFKYRCMVSSSFPLRMLAPSVGPHPRLWRPWVRPVFDRWVLGGGPQTCFGKKVGAGAGFGFTSCHHPYANEALTFDTIFVHIGCTLDLWVLTQRP